MFRDVPESPVAEDALLVVRDAFFISRNSAIVKGFFSAMGESPPWARVSAFSISRIWPTVRGFSDTGGGGGARLTGATVDTESSEGGALNSKSFIGVPQPVAKLYR